MIRLVINRDSERLIYELGEDDVLIGRSPPAEVLLESDAVSRRHTRLQKRPEGWRVADLGAANGTFLQRGGVPPPLRVIVEPLQSGDVICIERYRILFELHEGVIPSHKGLVEGHEWNLTSGEFRSPTQLVSLSAVQQAIEAAKASEPEQKVDWEGRLEASLALSSGTPLDAMSRSVPAGTPHLEVHAEGKPKLKLPLGAAPLQFGSDASCDVRMEGMTVPRFVAVVQYSDGRAHLQRLSSGILGPKVSVDGSTVRTADLSDGQRFFIGQLAVIVRIPR